MVHRRRAAVLRLDIAATVSSTARDLGPQGHAGHGADHRCECQAGAVRRDRPADGAPGRADPSTCPRCRCPGIPARLGPLVQPDAATAVPAQFGCSPIGPAHTLLRAPRCWRRRSTSGFFGCPSRLRNRTRWTNSGGNYIAANRQAASADALASNAAGWVLGLTPRQARRKAGMASMYRTRLSGHLVELCGAPEVRVEPSGACIERAAVAVLLDQPLDIVAGGQGADGVAYLVDGLEDAAVDGLLFQGSEEPLDDTIRLGLADEGVARRDAPEPGLLLEVVGHEVASVVVAEREATGGVGGEVAA